MMGESRQEPTGASAPLELSAWRFVRPPGQRCGRQQNEEFELPQTGS